MSGKCPAATVVACLLTSAYGAPPTIALKAVRVNPACIGGDDHGKICTWLSDCDSHECSGAITPTDRVRIDPGDVVIVEAFGANWSPGGEKLQGFQASLEIDSFTSGTTGGLVPWLAPDDCPECCLPEDVDCGLCFLGCCSDSARIAWGWPRNVQWRSDYAFGVPVRAPSVDIRASRTYPPSLVASVYDDARLYMDPPKFLFMLGLRASANACGTFTISLRRPGVTRMVQEDGSTIDGVTLEPMTIQIAQPELVVGSDPTDCTIDARQPFAPDGSPPEHRPMISLMTQSVPVVNLDSEDIRVSAGGQNRPVVGR